MDISEVLLLTLNFLVLVIAAGIIYVAVGIARTNRKVDHFMDWMNSVRPNLEKTILDLQTGLGDFKKATDVLSEVSTDIQEMTAAAKKVVIPSIQKVGEIKQKVEAVVSGVKTVINAFTNVQTNGKESHKARF